MNVDCCDGCDCDDEPKDPNPIKECCDDINVCQANQDNKFCCGTECTPTCNTLVPEPNPLFCCTKDDGCLEFNETKLRCCNGFC